MIYRCLVIDNSDFFEIGKIRVRLFQDTTQSDKVQDLSQDPKKRVDSYSNSFLEEDYPRLKVRTGMTDVFAVVTTPIGGAYDYGLWYLPQPNTWGIVSELEGGSPGEYVWLGATYQTAPISNNNAKKINFIGAPSDKDDRGNSEDQNALTDKKVNVSNKNAIVIKTKKAEVVRDEEGVIDQEESSSKLNWNARPLENLIIINEDEITIKHIIHNQEEDKEEERIGETTIKFDNGGLFLNTSNNEGTKSVASTLDLDNLSFSMAITDTEDEDGTTLSEIKSDTKKIELSFIEASKSSEKNNCNVTIGKRKSGLGNTEEAAISLTQSAGNGKYNEITMSEKTINVIAAENVVLQPGSGGKVCIGDTDSPVLISPTGGPIKVGTITIPTSKFLKA